VQSPSNPLIEDYTQIFNMIDEVAILPIQCEMSLMGPNSMRKVHVDCLSSIFIDFYVPVLTPRLSRTDTSLQLPENITLFAVCRIYTGVVSKDA
jgi:hypothetical protein